MKKNVLLTILFLFSIVFVYSQDKGYIAFSIGPTIPLADFGSKDINNEAAGFATTKALYEISFVQKFGKNLGLTLLVRGQANGVHTDPLLNELNVQYPDIPWAAENHNWGIYTALGGVYGSFPMGSGQLTLETRAMAGYFQASSPEFKFSAFSNNIYYEVNTQSATAAAIGYLFGVGCRLGVGKHLCFLFNVDYLGSMPEFEDVLTYSRIDATFTDTYNTFKQQFGTVNVGVGIGWRW